MKILTTEQQYKIEKAMDLLVDVSIATDKTPDISYKILSTYLSIASKYCREVADELAEKARED